MLKGKQHKLDKNKDGKISGADFKKMNYGGTVKKMKMNMGGTTGMKDMRKVGMFYGGGMSKSKKGY